MKQLYKILVCLLVSLLVLNFAACTRGNSSLDATLEASLVRENEPMLRVYNTETKVTTEMPIESYVAGVVAGEVYNTWDAEALKTQCVLARTFALKFAKDNPEEYKQKGISTSYTDTQQYDESTINSNITDACTATRGQVLSFGGELINAYFHSNSGGRTSLASVGLGATEDFEYIKNVDSPETENNSKNYSWSASFTKSELLTALNKMGVNVATLSSASLGQKDNAGRYLTVIIGGKEVSANTLRQNLGTTKMKSTKLTKVTATSSGITFTGLGYGHGVGVSQWGMQIFAQEGKSYKDIINYYYNNVNIKTVY